MTSRTAHGEHEPHHGEAGGGGIDEPSLIEIGEKVVGISARQAQLVSDQGEVSMVILRGQREQNLKNGAVCLGQHGRTFFAH